MLQYNNKLNQLKILFSLASLLITVFCSSLYAAGAEKASKTTPSTLAEVPVGTNSGNKAIIPKKRNTDVLLNDRSILNNYGITQSTDFSKSGFLRQDGSNLSSGFANRISLTSSIEYDSNPALAFDRKDPAFIYTIVPQATLDYVDEFSRYYLETALVFQRLSNNTILPDREDPNLTLGLDKTYASGTYGLSANYSQFLSRGQQLRVTGQFVPDDSGENTQRSRSIAGYLIHNLSDRWSVTANALYGQEDFSGGVGLVGSTLLDLRTKLNYEYSDRLNTYIQLGYVDLRPDRPLRDVELFRSVLGANYLFSDKLTGSFRAAQYQLSGGQSDTDWEAGALFTYNDERAGYSLELNRELIPVGGLGGFQKADTYRLGWIFNVSEVESFTAGFGLVKTLAGEGGFVAQDFREYNTAYNRTLWGNWNGRLGLSYRELLGSDSEYTNGYLVGISLIYGGFGF